MGWVVTARGVGTVCAALVLALVLMTSCGGESTSQSPGLGNDQAVEAAASCVQTYAPDTLVQRSFAFDGTVTSIEIRKDPRLPEGERAVRWVSFHVHRWFRGGTAPEVAVWIENLNIESSIGAVEAEPGTRLLVSGEPRWGGDALDDPIAWPCGFTQPWTEEAAAEWETAFS